MFCAQLLNLLFQITSHVHTSSKVVHVAASTPDLYVAGCPRHDSLLAVQDGQGHLSHRDGWDKSNNRNPHEENICQVYNLILTDIYSFFATYMFTLGH